MSTNTAVATQAARTRAPGGQGVVFVHANDPGGNAVIAFRRGDYAGAVDALYPRRGEVRLIGGSHAQRDVFARLLILAALKSGKVNLARALLAERAARNPNSAWTWTRSAEALAALGDAAGASAARERAARLLAA